MTPLAARAPRRPALILAALILALLVLVPSGARATVAAPSCMANPLGAAAPYNEFVLRNGTPTHPSGE